jgi:hypothetical protein
MRSLIIMKRAENAIYKVALYRASKSFPETGEKFINEVIDFCLKYAALKVNHPPCKNEILAKHGYSCAVYKKKWVIAFKYSDEEFRVYRFIWGPKLR